ncbi:MAG: hemolysin III family protein [Afipia sp.]|nr:hemolysin III family protein [Afipia sp.]
MAVFKLKQFTTDKRSIGGGIIRWDYDRAELIADGVVHILGIVFGLVAATALIVLASVYATAGQIVSVCIYAAGLLGMLGLSATYNLWPVSPVKWFLRRFDHSAIYVLIAGTYTPFLAHMQNKLLGIVILVGVWCVAAVGIYIKVKLPGRYDRLAVLLYLAMGWSGVMAYDSLVSSLPSSTLWLVAIGGVIYSLGVVFHAWERLRFQNAIWHSFVLIAAGVHYAAVLDLVLIST